MKYKDKKNANYDAGIMNNNIADACTEYMKIFGPNNNLMRHIPEVYDGLKIGGRRILYTMYINNLNYNSHHLKVASIVGDVMKIHPHGDTAIEDTLTKFAQPWANIQRFVDGKGNFGSITGDSPAAGRYIEARLSYYSYKCFFEEFSPDIVDMKPNYANTIMEPVVLPTKYPNTLINNSFGIGYGTSTAIPTYNFKEVCEATINLMNNPNIDNVVLVPDSPTGAFIIDEGQFTEISKEGAGKFRMRGEIQIDKERNCLIIKSTPMLTSWNTLKKPIIKLLSDGKTNLMKEIRNECGDGTFGELRYVIMLKKEVDPVSVMHMIYEKTQMEKSFGVQFRLIEDYTNKEYNIKSILQTWIDFRRETKRRFYAHKLSKYKERQHILDILLMILNKDNAEKTATIIKKSENTAECIKRLISTYGITSLQAKIIADMKFSALTKESYKRYVKEYEEITKEIEKVDKIIRSSKKIDKIIISELEEGIQLFGEDRKSKIITIDNEVKVRPTNHIIVLTENGYIKKLPNDVKSIGKIPQNDFPMDVIEVNNLNDVLLFDESGKVTKLAVHQIPASVINSEGIKLSELCSISAKVTTIKIRPDDETEKTIAEPLYFLMITKNGFIKKTLVSNYSHIKGSLLSIVLKDDDKLVCCKTVIGDKDVIVFTDKGLGIRFNTSEINDTGRMSVGVKAMELDSDEHIFGMDILNPNDKYIFVLTSSGYAKKCPLSAFETKSRNSRPLRIVSLNDNDGIQTIQTIKGKEKFRVYLKNDLAEIDVDNDIVELPRLSKGKKVIGVRKGDAIIKIKLM